MAPRPTLKIISRPGIQRDGTDMSSPLYTDGEWVRFYRGLPKKIGGYSKMTTIDEFDGTMRKLLVYPNQSTVLIYYFTDSEQGAAVTDVNLIGSGVKYEMTADGMPMGDFVWSVDTMFDALGSGASVIVAHPGDNLSSVDNNRATPVFMKDASSLTDDFAPIVISDATSTTGGITEGTNSLTVADATGFSIGETIRIRDAGMPFVARVVSINGFVVTLSARARISVVGAVCTSGALVTTATINAGSYDATFGAVTGLEVGDSVTINKAGGLDMFANITNIVGLVFTLDSNAENTVAGEAVDHVLGTDGGVVVLGQYLVTYGSNGRLTNSNVNAPAQYDTGDANEANIVGTKIVKGLPMRSGGGTSTSGLFWSTDSLIRMSFTGGATVFRYDTLSSQSSILAPESAIEYDGRYFWIGIDRFLMFAGAVQEVPNTVNQDYFFDGLNFEQRNKIWATKVPRYGEIWWFYPRGENTECSHYIVLNVRENTWYDGEIDRSAGFYSQVFRYPVWSDGSNIWFHEFGKDKIDGSTITSIQSSFTTRNFGLPGGGMQDAPQGIDQWQRLTRIEPDLVQSGDMSVCALTREYANSDDTQAEQKIFSPDTEKIDFRVQARYMRLKFISNATAGDYYMGNTLIHTEPGDQRQ